MNWAELIIGNLVLASLIGLLALAVGRGGRHAALAHTLWVMFFVKLVTPPIISVPMPIPSLSALPPSIQNVALADTDAPSVSVMAAAPLAISDITNSDLAKTDLTDTEPSRNHQPAHATNAETVAGSNHPDVGGTSSLLVGLGTLWLAGIAIVAIRGCIRLVKLRRLLSECGQDDPDATQIVRDLLRRNGQSLRWRRVPIVKRVQVRISPMLFGFVMRPIIVCPEQLWATLSLADRKAFLAHETAHYFRRDHWVRWLEWFVSAIYWWFPGVHFARKQLERHEEACCDSWAVRILETKPRSYAEALLKVVDFISDHQVGLPRFASGMHPTDSLEERLRLLMKNELDHVASPWHRWGCGLACATIWMVHPDIYHLQWTASSANAQSSTPSDIENVAKDNAFPLPTIEGDDRQQLLEPELPDPPRGFWNAAPSRNWAGVSFEVSGHRLAAQGAQGFILQRDDALSDGPAPITFESQDLTTIAEIPASGRVLIGDQSGNVRLWDFDAGMPVSLIGRHAASVTSLAVSANGSVYSADAHGSIIRWQIQSGQTLARWDNIEIAESGPAMKIPIQSIRVSNDGLFVAALSGDWRDATTAKTLSILDPQNLTLQSQLDVAPDTAIVLQNGQGHWCCVSWSGMVRSLIDGQTIGFVPKHEVSALLLSQQASFHY